jgi:hypothetical protein
MALAGSGCDSCGFPHLGVERTWPRRRQLMSSFAVLRVSPTPVRLGTGAMVYNLDIS